MSQICTNAEALFALTKGESFECDFSATGFAALRKLLLSQWSEPPGATQCMRGKKCVDLAAVGAGERPSCAMCWNAKDERGDCSAMPGCNSDRCTFCTNLEQ